MIAPHAIYRQGNGHDSSFSTKKRPDTHIASGRFYLENLLAFGLNNFFATINARRRDVVTQMNFT